nr:prealbumin-like fold domain-containing protein [Collinsella urealyticum]
MLLSPARVRAEADETVTVTSITVGYSHRDPPPQFIRVDGNSAGNIGYCAQGYLKIPLEGQRLTSGGKLGIPEVDYVLYHGYDGEIVREIGGLQGERAELATALAAWLAIADQRPDLLTFTGKTTSYHGNRYYYERWAKEPDPEVKQVAWDLYQAGLAYRNQGEKAPEQGCAHLWLQSEGSSSPHQSILTATKKIPIIIEKRSSSPELTGNNPSYSLANAQYEIFRSDTHERVAHLITDEQGNAHCSLAPNQNYYAVETAASPGYLVNPEQLRVNVETTPLTVHAPEQPACARLVISKRDSATLGIAQAGATLEGAVYHISSRSTPGWEATGATSAEGVVIFENIPLGTIDVRELKAPVGYLLDERVHTYEITPQGQNEAGIIELIPEADFVEHPLTFDIEISKFLDARDDQGSKLERPGVGISFDIISGTTNETVGTITTDHDGHATTAGQWFGAGDHHEHIHGALPYDQAGYTVRERAETVPEGFAPVSDWTIPADQMVNGATLRYTVGNRARASRLQIIKTDAETGKTVPLAGFSFQILDFEGNPIVQKAWYPSPSHLDTFTTGDDGTVTLPGLLQAGSYKLREIAAPAPYVVTIEELPFTVEGEDQGDPFVVIRVANDRAYGRLHILKTPQNSDEPLAGARFDIAAAQDIVLPDGTVIATEGQVMDHIETDQDGRAESRPLPLGGHTTQFHLIERKAPLGYVMQAEPILIEFTWHDRDTKEVVLEQVVANEPTKTELSKRDVSTENEVAGAELALFDAEGNEIASWTSTTEPHRIEALPPGTYTLVERMTPRTYDLANPVEFSILETEEIQTVVMHDAPLTISGEVDKQQEVARPLAQHVEAACEGGVPAQESEDGSYAYTIAFRNTSNSWTDECTVEDELLAVKEGRATLVAVTTPVTVGDADNKMNLWFQTNHSQSEDAVQASDANATLTDGVDNPWLSHPETKKTLGDDGRALDYTGWRLWKQDLPTDSSTTLFVSDLGLDPDEHVIGLRFEYGRVEKHFTTIGTDWNRPDRKRPHDDIKSAQSQRAHDAEAAEPARIQLKVTDSYTEGSPLENYVQLSLYRNGGGTGLEGHDEDHVIQRAVPKHTPLPQTGTTNLLPAIVTTATIGCVSVIQLLLHVRPRL